MANPPNPWSPELTAACIAAAQTADDLALLLRKLRRRQARQLAAPEVTIRDLAAKAGWSRAVVGDYFTGQTLPPTDRFDMLIRLLGATPAEQGALATARDRVEETRRAAPSRQPAPRQLPAGVPGFVGRRAELANLNRFAERARRPQATALCLVTGVAGTGKTVLALHWAHRVTRRFPHGQLYADLCGYSPDSPARPGRVLGEWLAGLGVPAAAIPAQLDARAALFRSLLHGRRLLIVLDNAASPQQVRPLLPGTGGSLVVVTSRSTLTGLVARDRAHRIHLDVLPPEAAVAVLAGFAGPGRLAAEPAAARRLAELCAYLPVALCVLGEQVAARPGTPLASIAAELAGASRPLDLLDAGGDHRTAVRAVFGWSYQRLPPAPARLFRLLGGHSRSTIDRYAAATLAGTDLRRAGRLLDRLVSVGLLQPEPPDQYRLPWLLRAYAEERAYQYGGGVRPVRPVRPPRPARYGPAPAPARAPRLRR